MGTRPPIVRLDSTQLNSIWSGTSGCIVVFVFVVVYLPWSCLSVVESFNSVRSAEVGGRAGFARCTTRKKVGFAWPPNSVPIPGYATRYMGAGVLGYMVTPRHKLRVAGTPCHEQVHGAQWASWAPLASVALGRGPVRPMLKLGPTAAVSVCVFFQSSVCHLYPVHSHFCCIARSMDYVASWLRTLYHRRVCVCSCMWVGAQYL